MKYKILSTSPTFGHYISEPLKYFKDNGCEVTLVPQGKKLSEEELVENMAELDAAIVGVEKITQRVIQGSKRLKVIAKHGAGVDNIDVKTATSQGVVVISAPGANSDAVADLTFGLFLSLARSISFADRAVKGGGWPRIVGIDLSGKTLGIIGLGQVGKKVAKRALGFDMRVLVYDVIKDEAFAQKWGINYRSLDEILVESDFLSVHVPLIDSTRNLIGKRELELMKNDAFLVNIARGGVVDEEALYHALKERKVRGAALDVFSSEPPAENPLLELDNVIATPHMGGYTTEALRETGMICARGIVDTLRGKRPEHIVNPEVLK